MSKKYIHYVWAAVAVVAVMLAVMPSHSSYGDAFTAILLGVAATATFLFFDAKI